VDYRELLLSTLNALWNMLAYSFSAGKLLKREQVLRLSDRLPYEDEPAACGSITAGTVQDLH
jgi:hypothetical protein